MSDLTAKLTLDAKQFDSELKRVEAQAKQSGNVISSSINGNKIASEIDRANKALTEEQKNSIYNDLLSIFCSLKIQKNHLTSFIYDKLIEIYIENDDTIIFSNL